MSVRNYKQTTLTLETRVKVIQDSEKGMSQRNLAKKYKCGKTQIQKILKDKGDIIIKWKQNVNRHVKRNAFQRHAEVNNLTLAWFQGACARGMPISGPILQEKAKDFAKRLNKGGFTASNGWLQSFCKRHNIVFRSICGEKSSVNDDTFIDWVSRLPYILKDYTPKDIYNIDETGLFFRALPHKTLTEKGAECVGGKISKDRITIMLCTNAIGDKEVPLVIHKSFKPRCFQNVDMNNLCVYWYANRRAWMTREIFIDWLTKFDAKIRKEQRSIVILLDNAPCHPAHVELSNIKLIFLPANTSSKSQPLDQGIIQAFKLHYRKRILTALVARIDDTTNIHDITKSISIADAIQWLVQAWESVQKTTISKCFEACGINTDCNYTDMVDEITSTQNELTHFCTQRNIEILTNFDDNEPIFDGDSEDWEKDLVDEAIRNRDGETSLATNTELDQNKEENIECIPLSKSLKVVNELKTLAYKLGNNKLMNLLYNVESEFEREILLKTVRGPKIQTQIDQFLEQK